MLASAFPRGPTRSDELSVTDLPVDGRIRDDLRGVYLRNGLDPKFPPLDRYTYPLDGDGMIRGIWLADGAARYRNRYGDGAQLHDP